MKQILLMIAVVALVGCGGKKEDGNTGVVKPIKPSPKAAPEKLISEPIVEENIRESIIKYTGELTKTDLEKVKVLILNEKKLTNLKSLHGLINLERLYLNDNQLTDVNVLKKLPKLEMLSLFRNPDLTKAQIDELKKALPKCTIFSDYD